jgi:hypothetical protein
MATTPTPLRTWNDRRLLLWIVAGQLLATALIAPWRPWGWAGAGLLPAAALLAVVAWRSTGGLPPRRYWPALALGVAALTLVFRLLGYGGLSAS